MRDRQPFTVTRPSPSRISAISVFAASLLATASPAAAKFSVCNRTAHPASVALGFFDGKFWTSVGWWTVAARDCAALINEPLNARYYYLYAEHEGVGGTWDGDRSFCVKQAPFNLQGRADCLAHGFDVKRFFQVDTGNSIDWIQNLAD